MAETSRRRTVTVILLVLVGILAAAGLALAAVFLFSRMLPGFEATSTPETTSAPASSQVTSSEETSVATVTETVPATSSPAASPSTSSSVAAAASAGGSTTPKCDGRGVMIIESVIDDGTGAAPGRIADLLAQHPGAQWYQPGACPSLRGSVDGQSVYPVVMDYGRDFDRLCADYYAAGADPSYRNARILNNAYEAQSPC